MRFIDITGKTFGRWTVLEKSENIGSDIYWKCQCECGRIVTVCGRNIKSGISRSCGCFHKENVSRLQKTHGKSKTPEYTTWIRMIGRCENANSDDYIDYGGRGIKVCPHWRESFETFYEDMGIKPSPRHSIDRIDVNGNYEKGNCRWATDTEQSRNKRKFSTNKSGYAGIFHAGGKYKTSISVNNQRIHLGGFSDINDAIKARKEAEIKYWNKQPSA